MMAPDPVNPERRADDGEGYAAAVSRLGQRALATRWCAILAALLCAATCLDVTPQAGAQDSVGHDDAAVRVGETFTIGPFARDMRPVPLTLTLDLDPADMDAALEVVELDQADEEIGNGINVYPSLLTGGSGLTDVIDAAKDVEGASGERASPSEIRFVPFADGVADHWEARTQRRFVVRRANDPTTIDEPLTVASDDDTVTITNPHYAVTLEHPEGELEGSANDIIREITFGDGPSLQVPRTRSDVVLDGDVYRWRFEPMGDRPAMQVTDHFALLQYRGRFGAPGRNDKVDRLRWRLALLFHRTLPLIEVSVRIEQTEETFDRFGLCRFLQVYFDPSDDDAPLKKVQTVGGGRRHSRDLIAALGDAALLGVVNRPHARTSGTIWTRQPPTSAFVCSIWEGDAVLAETMSETGFFLLLSDDPTLKDQMADYWSSLGLLSDLNERVRIRNLFDAH